VIAIDVNDEQFAGIRSQFSVEQIPYVVIMNEGIPIIQEPPSQ